MNYLKGGLFGAVGAVVAAMLWVLVAFVLPIVLPMLISRLTGEGGASGARITSDSIWIAALIGFVIGFFWGVRR
jgi:hypothetical protein